MTDNDFMELVADELHAYITAEQVPLYEIGMFEDCHYVKEKTCQRILSDWCNNVIGW